MNEGVGDLYDGSGNQNHGTISGAPWATGESGHLPMTALVRQNSPMVCDGSDDYVDIDDTGLQSTIDSETFSLGLWVYPSGNDNALFSCAGTEFSLETNASDQLKLIIDGGTRATTTETLPQENWIYVCLTVDSSGNDIIYFNGVKTSVDVSHIGSWASATFTNQLAIGARSAGTVNWDGSISEVAIWDVALDADAVTALYNLGTPLDATTDSGNYDNSDGLVGYWRNDGITTWTDRSTNSNHGTVSGSPASIVLTEGITSGRDSQGFYLTDTTENCLTLNGAEYVEIPDSDVLDNIFDGGGTVEAWIYVKGWGESNAGRIASKCGSGNVSGWNFNITNSGILQFLSDWSTTDLNAYAGTIALNTWYHVAVTFNSTAVAGTDPILYIDGDAKSLTITDSVGSVVTDAGSNLRIGIRGSGLDRQFDGKIDDVRIYSDALSASEVEKNYNAGKSKHS